MPDLRVNIWPFYRGVDDGGGGGIRRVVDAQHKYLPEFGIETATDAGAADLLVVHAGSLTDIPVDMPAVAHCHGLYWTAEETWPRWAHELNARVISVMCQADAITAATEWVADSIRRGLLREVSVIPLGIDIEEWAPGQNEGYVLWNKNRPDPVCDPRVVNELARRAPRTRFLSTFGEPAENVKLLGRVDYAAMHALVANAAVYLCSARETFGIGTLEAMAAGVPVLGWKWGGQNEIPIHGQCGYLAEPGNYEELREGLDYCLQNRASLGARGMEVARLYPWRGAIEKYADLYRRVFQGAEERAAAPKVSVIVPCYNHAQWLEEQAASLAAQTMRDFEVVIVDDCSPDGTATVAQGICARDPRFKYVRTPQNLYLSGARNHGIQNARGRYILPLDADDMLTPLALEVLSEALDRDRTKDIAFGAMEVLEVETGKRWKSEWPYGDFSWPQQMMHRNQIPYSSLFRRKVWSETGGYRTRVNTAEDADFWCRVTSFGHAVVRATDAPVLIKRDHKDSMGYTVPEPDWPAWFGWTHDIKATPCASVGPAPDGMCWPVHSFERPEVSVIIPVGPKHGKIVRDALDSLLAQSFSNWEAIVIDDTRGAGVDLWGFPFVRLLHTDGVGVARARNAGLQAARGAAVVFLDADDYLQPGFLAACFEEFERQCREAVVYTDFYRQDELGKVEPVELNDFEQAAVLQKGQYSVTAMYPRAGLLKWAPHDESLPTAEVGWEDWDMQIALTVHGYCGVRLPQPLFTYRFHTGERREQAFAQRDVMIEAIRSKWIDYYDGGVKMAGCRGCGGTGRSVAQASAQGPARRSSVQTEGGKMAPNGQVLVEYMGSQQSKFRIRGRGTGAEYIFGRDGFHDRAYVFEKDLAEILALGGMYGPMQRAPLHLVEPAATPVPIRVMESRPVAAASPPPPPINPPVLLSATRPSEPPAPAPNGDPAAPGTEETPGGLFVDPTALNIETVRKVVRGMGLAQLTQMREMEERAAARKTVFEAIDLAIRILTSPDSRQRSENAKPKRPPSR